MQMKLNRGQKVMLGSQEGYVLRYFGANAVQFATVREKLILAGFPAKPVGTQMQHVKESWPVARITIAQPS